MIYPKQILKTRITLVTVLITLVLFLLLQTSYANLALQKLAFVDLKKYSSDRLVQWPGLLSFSQYSLLRKSPYFLTMTRCLSTTELWRYITPSLLHMNLSHLLFNLLWFGLYAADLEKKIGSLASFLLLIFASASSNFTQFLFQGPFFLGLSGVNAFLVGIALTGPLCNTSPVGLAKKRTAKAGSYLMILAALTDLIIFFLRKTFSLQIPSLQIAHFAHLSGWLGGILLGPIVVGSPFAAFQSKGNPS